MRWVRAIAIAVGCALIGFIAVGAPSTPAASQTGLPTLPPLPPPPADGTIISDILGPAATGGCDSVALVFALAAPIAGAQLTPELKALVDQATPYLSLATYACGFLVSPPSAFKCAPDKQVADFVARLNLSQLGVPVNIPEAAKVAYETAAGIENIFLRLGIPIEQSAARALADALGCAVPPPVVDPPAAAAPSFPSSAGSAGTPGSTSFVAIGSPGAPLPPVVSVGGSRTVPAVTTTGPKRYPVDGLGAALLALPLVLLAAGTVAAPRLRKRVR